MVTFRWFEVFVPDKGFPDLSWAWVKNVMTNESF